MSDYLYIQTLESKLSEAEKQRDELFEKLEFIMGNQMDKDDIHLKASEFSHLLIEEIMANRKSQNVKALTHDQQCHRASILLCLM